jgi:hypothetical protein
LFKRAFPLPLHNRGANHLQSIVAGGISRSAEALGHLRQERSALQLRGRLQRGKLLDERRESAPSFVTFAEGDAFRTKAAENRDASTTARTPALNA